MALHAFDLRDPTHTPRVLVRGGDLAKQRKPLSREEELRRERRRTRIHGVTVPPASARLLDAMSDYGD